MATRFIAGLAAIALGASPSLACDCIRLTPDSPHFDRDMNAIVEGAAVIAEGIIVRPMGPRLEPAIFRPTRIFKGPRQESYQIGIISDCGLLLRAEDVVPGQTIRLILYGGPDLYEASRCVNFQDAAVDAAVLGHLVRTCGIR